MKLFSLIYILLLTGNVVRAQQTPFEQLDSLSNAIATLEKQTAEKEYKDSNGPVYSLDFPEMNFKVWIKDRLATRSMFRRTGDKETVYITDRIDLSKVTAITIREDYKGVVGLRLAFPAGHLKTQHIEGSKVIKTEEPEHLDFYCRYGAVDEQKQFYFDRMFDYLYGLVTLLRVEKGLMTSSVVKQESEDWLKLRSEAFIAKYPGSILKEQAALNAAVEKVEKEKLQKQVDYINQLAATYKFKKGLTKDAFISYNPEAGFLFRRKAFRNSGTAVHDNTRGLGNPWPEGPHTVGVFEADNQVIFMTQVVYSGTDVSLTEKINAMFNEVRRMIEPRYITKDENQQLEINVPGAAAKIMLNHVHLNKRQALMIHFN